MSRKIAVIGVGNMAKAIVSGIIRSNVDVSSFYLFDVNTSQYSGIVGENVIYSNSIDEAVSAADCILLSVKPQNFSIRSLRTTPPKPS